MHTHSIETCIRVPAVPATPSTSMAPSSVWFPVYCKNIIGKTLHFIPDHHTSTIPQYAALCASLRYTTPAPATYLHTAIVSFDFHQTSLNLHVYRFCILFVAAAAAAAATAASAPYTQCQEAEQAATQQLKRLWFHVAPGMHPGTMAHPSTHKRTIL